MIEWSRGEGKEEDWVETEVDGVFGYVDEEEGDHASGLVMLVRIWSIVMLRLGVMWNELNDGRKYSEDQEG